MSNTNGSLGRGYDIWKTTTPEDEEEADMRRRAREDARLENMIDDYDRGGRDD